MSKILEFMPEQPKESKIAYRTCFSSLSYYGYKLDILKSGLQKYLRRREEEKMLWCLGEIYLFKVYANSEQEKKATRGIITNLINRIIVMLDEELLFIEWDKYLIIYNLIEKFEKEERNDFVSLIKICKILCNSRLLRRNSDINAYFNFEMRKADSKKPEILEEREEGEDVDNWHFRNFKAYFEKGDINCFYWMYKIYIARREGDKRRFKRKENIYMVWEFLLKIGFGNPLLTKCLNYRLKEFFNKSKKERGIFLTSAIDLCLEKNNITWSADALKNEPDVNVEDVENLFRNREKLVFDSYVIDMHTSLGRKMGKNAINFMEEGSYVKDEDQEFLEREWRETYNNGKLESYAKKLAEKKAKAMKKAEKEKMKEAKKAEKVKKAKKKTVKIVKSGEQKEEPKKGKTDREKIRAAKYKRIKKMRGKVNFDDLEKNLKFVDGLNIQKEKLILCSDTTCGNKVMCFEYEGKIWKESRKSMFYNRDYCVIDECKELFGLRKIGMERVLSNFRIEKIDKSKKSWKDNWHKVIIGEDEENVVYCVMNKITHCNWKIPMEIGNIKHSLVYGVENGGNIGQNRALFKEFVKIGVYRGIFRCSDFNCRNVLVGLEDQFSPQYLVSIDEGDIGKRLDILGGREKWLVDGLNADKKIISEIIYELTLSMEMEYILNKMKEYKFSNELCVEVLNNWKNLKKDLEAEGILFD